MNFEKQNGPQNTSDLESAKRPNLGGQDDRNGLVDVFTGICLELRDQCLNLYGPNLTSLAVFGSVGRGTPAYQSDIDFLVIRGEP